MHSGHRSAQRTFLHLGRLRGYVTQRSYSPELPTDGIWCPPREEFGTMVPVVALEVAASESPKTMQGSVMVLSAVAPALGLLVIQDEEITRRVLRDGRTPLDAAMKVERTLDLAHRAAASVPQRIKVLRMHELQYFYDRELALFSA